MLRTKSDIKLYVEVFPPKKANYCAILNKKQIDRQT